MSKPEYAFLSSPEKRTNFFIKCTERSGEYLNKIDIIFNEIGPDLNLRLIFHKIIQSCKNLHDITLIDGEKGKFLSEAKLSALFSRNANLQEIYLGSLGIRGDCLLKVNPNPVKALAIFDFPKLQFNYFYEFLSKLKNLSILRIHYIYWTDIEQVKIIQALIESNCENMTKIFLDFHFTTGLDTVLSKFLSKQKKLSSIDLAQLMATESIMNSLSADSLESLNINFNGEFKFIDHLKNLRQLLCRVDNITDESVSLLSECVKLENIYIFVKDSYSLTSIGENYFSRFQNLVKFKFLFNNGNKSIDNVLKALTRCQKIKNMIVSSSNLTKIGLSHISSLPNLEILDISYTAFTDENYWV